MFAPFFQHYHNLTQFSCKIGLFCKYCKLIVSKVYSFKFQFIWFTPLHPNATLTITLVFMVLHLAVIMDKSKTFRVTKNLFHLFFHPGFLFVVFICLFCHKAKVSVRKVWSLLGTIEINFKGNSIKPGTSKNDNKSYYMHKLTCHLLSLQKWSLDFFY